MAYEYESELRNYLIGHKNVNPKFDGFEILESLEEIKEVYRKAQAFDNYMVDLVKSMETYPHDYLKYDDFEKETYDFYMQDKEDFIKSYENDRRSGHEMITDVEEYDRIIKSMEDKQND